MTEQERMESFSDKIKLDLSIHLSSPEYILWIDPLVPYSLEDGVMTFIAPTENTVKTLNENYLGKFRNIASNLKLPITDFLFKTKNSDSIDSSKLDKEEKKNIEEKEARQNPFVIKYTFANFVIADSNRFAAEAARTVAQNPGAEDNLLTLNPLYIYGGVGLGKTHLLHAVGNYLFVNKPELNVVYTTAEKISNDYFASLNQYSTDKDAYRNFRKKYSQCDVLMVDDIQFMQKKGGLQEVFFHIFNDLYLDHKQIILSSDRPPKEINDIEDRLRSRFESGIMADISSPSLDTRINIIKKKLEVTPQFSDENIILDDNIINYLAETINTNIRELEGALQKIIMFCNLTHKKPTIEIARETMKEREQQSSEQLDSDKIINAVSNYYGISYEDIIGKKKTKNIAEARMMAIYLVCNLLNLPLINIGKIFGGRDHSTIMYSRDKISTQMGLNNNVFKAAEDIKNNLGVDN